MPAVTATRIPGFDSTRSKNSFIKTIYSPFQHIHIEVESKIDNFNRQFIKYGLQPTKILDNVADMQADYRIRGNLEAT